MHSTEDEKVEQIEKSPTFNKILITIGLLILVWFIVYGLIRPTTKDSINEPKTEQRIPKPGEKGFIGPLQEAPKEGEPGFIGPVKPK